MSHLHVPTTSEDREGLRRGDVERDHDARLLLRGGAVVRWTADGEAPPPSPAGDGGAAGRHLDLAALLAEWWLEGRSARGRDAADAA